LVFLSKKSRKKLARLLSLLALMSMGLRFSFPNELRIYLTSRPQGWKEEIVPFLLEQSITYERATT
jgi:hypothetical protein